MGILKFGFLAGTMLLGFSTLAFDDVNKLDVEVLYDSSSFGDEKFIGNWKYSAENVPYEYAKGILFISKEEGSLKVVVALPGGKRKADDVVAKENTLTFSLNLDGQLVSVSIILEGDKISGKAISEEGIFKLSGERRLDTE